MYVVAKIDSKGHLIGYVSSGRPCTIRVYESLKEAENGMRQKKARTYSLVPIKLTTGVTADGEANLWSF